jgi:hypothetical protein
MNSSSLTLNKSDRLKSVAIAVIAAVLAALQQALAAHSFDFVAYDWAGILDLSLKVAGCLPRQRPVLDQGWEGIW